MAHDREVAGIRCFEVLAALSDYLDDELPPARRAAVDAHLAGCDRCARFGGVVGATVRRLRAELSAAEATPEGVVERLDERLRRELDGT